MSAKSQLPPTTTYLSLIGKTPSDGLRRSSSRPRLQMSHALTDELGEVDAVLGGDHLSCLLGGKPLRDRKFADLYGEFFCQVVFWFVPVPCLERKGGSSSRRLRSGSRSARKGVKGPKC